MKTERRTGVTRELLQILQDNVDTVVTMERLAELVNYDKHNVSTLIQQLRRSKPNLIIEVPTSGAYVYRGFKPFTEITGEELPQPLETPVKATKRSVKAMVNAPITVGELVEVIGYGQDGTPLVRDPAGKIYLLQPL